MKIIKVLSTVVIISLFGILSAGAADYDKTNNTVALGTNQTAASGTAEYVVMVVKASQTDISSDDIYYIDQASTAFTTLMNLGLKTNIPEGKYKVMLGSSEGNAIETEEFFVLKANENGGEIAAPTEAALPTEPIADPEARYFEVQNSEDPNKYDASFIATVSGCQAGDSLGMEFTYEKDGFTYGMKKVFLPNNGETLIASGNVKFAIQMNGIPVEYRGTFKAVPYAVPVTSAE